MYILILVLHDGRCLRAHHINFKTLQDCAYFAGIVQWVGWGISKPSRNSGNDKTNHADMS